MTISMDGKEDVLFQDTLYKLKQSKSGRFNRVVQEQWKTKYFVLCCHGDQLVLKYYNKKPKQLRSAHAKTQMTIWPSFKVEKLSNSHNRAFAVEVTTSSHQLCLSADEQTSLDKFVFLLQTQVRLRENISDNLIQVKTETSEAFTRIGAKGTDCVLHISPWGLTLALQESRAVLAQWPLKSVRYYESSGQGQFIIETGTVAPMGDGVYNFHTLPGLDNRLYDAVDHFVINTLDRVKPNQRGTAEEIEDYIRECDCLHALTVLTPTCLASHSEVSRCLRDNWNSSLEALGAGESGGNPSPVHALHLPAASNRLSASESSPAILQDSVSSPVPSSNSPLISDNTSRPLPSPQMPHPERQRYSPRVQRSRDSPRQRGSESPRQMGSPGGEGRVSGRPPPLPPSSGLHGSARLARGSPRSARQDSVDGAVLSPPGSELQPRRFSNPASVALRVTHDMELHPAAPKQKSWDSRVSGMNDNMPSSHQRRPHSSPRSPVPPSPPGSAGRSSCPVSPNSPHHSGAEHAVDGEHKMDAPVEDWLVSASCEDLSDHMRAVIFHQRQSQRLASAAASGATQKEKENTNNNDPNFIPPPFTNIVDFSSSVEWDRNKARDRSQSFDVNSKVHRNPRTHHGTSSGSASLSIRQIRKMVCARTATKETLRKSLSNPNFLNLGSKEKLYQHRTQAAKPAHPDCQDTPRLSAQNKHKSRSLASLLPSTLRHYISRESLSHPATSTNSPHVHHSQQHSQEVMPNNASDSSFHRQQSAVPSQEMSVKGIRFTQRSRSFRKPKSHQRSKSADPLHRDRVDQSIVAGAEGHSPQYLHSDAEAERDATSPGNAAGQSSEGSGTSGKCDSESRARVALMNGAQALPQSPNWSYC